MIIRFKRINLMKIKVQIIYMTLLLICCQNRNSGIEGRLGNSKVIGLDSVIRHTCLERITNGIAVEHPRDTLRRNWKGRKEDYEQLEDEGLREVSSLEKPDIVFYYDLGNKGAFYFRFIGKIISKKMGRLSFLEMKCITSTSRGYDYLAITDSLGVDLGSYEKMFYSDTNRIYVENQDLILRRNAKIAMPEHVSHSPIQFRTNFL